MLKQPFLLASHNSSRDDDTRWDHRAWPPILALQAGVFTLSATGACGDIPMMIELAPMGGL